LRLGEAVELAVLRGDQQIVLHAILAKRSQKAAVQKR
jgi:hypothetical protein